MYLFSCPGGGRHGKVEQGRRTVISGAVFVGGQAMRLVTSAEEERKAFA